MFRTHHRPQWLPRHKEPRAELIGRLWLGVPLRGRGHTGEGRAAAQATGVGQEPYPPGIPQDPLLWQGLPLPELLRVPLLGRPSSECGAHRQAPACVPT